jgi:hypothetical protein
LKNILSSKVAIDQPATIGGSLPDPEPEEIGKRDDVRTVELNLKLAAIPVGSGSALNERLAIARPGISADRGRDSRGRITFLRCGVAIANDVEHLIFSIVDTQTVVGQMSIFVIYFVMDTQGIGIFQLDNNKFFAK